MKDKGKRQLNKYNYTFRCASAKNGYNIREIFQELCREIIERKYKNLRNFEVPLKISQI